MSVNNPEIQVLSDRDDVAIVKVIGYYNAVTNSNTTIISANALAWANNSQPCVISALSVQSAVSISNGYAQLYWVGKSANVAMLNIGGDSGYGTIEGYMTNQIYAANTANLASNSGDIGLSIVGAVSGDAYSLIIKVRKEAGYANAYIGYNDSSYRP